MSLVLAPQGFTVVLNGAEGQLLLGRSVTPRLRLEILPVLAGGPGAAGPALELRRDGAWLQWRVVGAAEWVNLVALADISGADGLPAEFRSAGGFIQWRLVGAPSWTNLLPLADITGAPGPAGQTGGANIDGGRPDSVYGGTEPIDGGTP